MPQPCPRCGSKNTWRVTTTSTTTMTMGDNMTRESMCDKYVQCDDCKHKWRNEK